MHRAIMLSVCFLLALTGLGEPAAAKRVALVIGNSAYEQVARLPNPARDARAVAAALKRLGFAVTLKLDQDYSALRRALGAFARTAAGADVAAIFYAGHGIEVGGQNYLIPTDAQLAHANDVDFEAIPLSTAMGALENANGLKLVILDACRNNPFAAKMARSGATRAVGRGLARVSPRGGDTLVWPTPPRRARWPTMAMAPTAPYTAALLKHLETSGLEIRLLFGRVRDSVLDSTGKRQEPFTYGSLGGQAIYLKGGGGPAALPRSTGELAALQTRLKQLEDRLRRQSEQPRDEPKVAVGVFPKQPKTGRQYNPGDEFRDCDACPRMVVLPSGSFTMGSPASEPKRDKDEGPRHKVRIPRAFAVGKFEVTFSEWDACVADGGCGGYRPVSGGWGRGKKPVINVSWDDAKAYVTWLSRKTGKTYRLLSESEWEYAARAGTTTPFYTGQRITADQANFDGNYTYNGSRKGRYRKQTVTVGTFGANAFSLHDLYGNVWEWVEDCWKDSYRNAPTDGSVSTSGDCSQRVLRGGSWINAPRNLRSAYRYRNYTDIQNYSNGFRIARTLTP